MSFRVAKGVTCRIGDHRGTYVRGPDESEMIDEGGRASVSDQRVLDTSTQQNREWVFEKLVDMYHEGGTTFTVATNRRKTPGFAYGDAVAEAVEGRVTPALALFEDEVDALISNLRDDARELGILEPPRPAALPG